MDIFNFLPKLKEGTKLLISIIDFFNASGLEKFEYKLEDKYLLTIYRVEVIIRIDIKKL